MTVESDAEPAAIAADRLRGLDMLVAGGLFIKDDLTPRRSERDEVREFLLGHPQLTAVEILTTRSTAAIIAAKRA